jgi:hypothetical protein
MQMKHDLEAFSRDIIAIIKKSGDSGGSGDNPAKLLQHNNYSVTTRQQNVSPLQKKWCQIHPASGDGKSERLESVKAIVTSVTTVTTNFEDGLAAQNLTDDPTGWHAILEELKQTPAPEWVSVDRWLEMAEDAGAFLSDWSNAAHDLGWTALNLFGVHPVAPGARYDVIGLVPILRWTGFGANGTCRDNQNAVRGST